MKVTLYGIFDVKTKAFLRPFAALRDGEAIRSFEDLVNDGQSMVSRHPEDFVLFKIGSFNDQNGEYENLTNERVINAIELKKDGRKTELDEVIEKEKEKKNG